MHELESQFGRWVIKYRWLMIAACLLMVFAAASGGKNLGFDTSYRVFFSEDNPQLLAFDELEKAYSKNDNVLFVLTPKDGNVFTPRTLSAVEYLTEKSWQVPYSTRVDSLANYQHTEAEEDDLIVENLFEDAVSLTQSDLERVKNIALSKPLLLRRVISPSGHVTAVNVTIQLPGVDEVKETPEVVNFTRQLAEEFKQQYPDIEIRMTGMVLMNNAFSEESQNDMQSLVPLSFAVMLIMLGLLLRGFSGTFVTLLVIMFSIMAAMGIGGYIGFPITAPSASAPTIILTVAIANSVHILVTFLAEMRAGKDKHSAIVESLRINLQPVFLASITTAIGFLTMLFSEVPPFQHLGVFVAFGVLVSFVLSVTFLPALLSLLPVRTKITNEQSDPMFLKLGEWVVARKNQLFYGMAAFALMLIAFVPSNELNDVFVEYFDESVQFRTDSDYTSANLTGLYLIDYSAHSGEEGGISNPEFLKELAEFAEWYREQPETLHVNTYTDIMKRLNKNMHGDDPAYYRLPEDRNLAAQYLLLYEMSLPYGLDLNNQINVDKSSTRFTVSVKTISTNDLLALEKRASDWLAQNAKHITKAEASGPVMMFAHIGKRNIISMLMGTTLALILISIILIFALRSFKLGLISMMPNLIPAAMGFGIWAMFVGEVGLALSIVTGMTLGIVVDDTVHFLSKYRRGRVEKELPPPEAVKYAFSIVGRALYTTSCVLVAGFLVLSLSSFELNSGMGLLSAIVITMALIADFFLLPTLLMKFEERKNEKVAIVREPVSSTAV